MAVAVVILLTATACTLDAPTPTNATTTAPGSGNSGDDSSVPPQPEVTSTTLRSVNDGAVDTKPPEATSTEPSDTDASEGESVVQPSEATSTVTTSTVAKRVDDGTGDGAAGDSRDGRPIPGGSLTEDGHYADPRGDTYEEFQASFDRTHPFQGLESFCVPTPAPEAVPVATQPGITADSLNIVHLHTRLDELEKIGFSSRVGDIDDMVRSFVGIVNECGAVARFLSE